MIRNIPSFNNSLLFFLRGGKRSKDLTPDNYVERYNEYMVNHEKIVEKDLIDLMGKIGINASVKSDRYSLPFNKQVVHTGYGESYLNGAFETDFFFRKIMKEMIDTGSYKVRFYVLCEIEDSFPMGKVNYYFNYYKHEPKL